MSEDNPLQRVTGDVYHGDALLYAASGYVLGALGLVKELWLVALPVTSPTVAMVLTSIAECPGGIGATPMLN